jgi:hypothetical protein
VRPRTASGHTASDGRTAGKQVENVQCCKLPGYGDAQVITSEFAQKIDALNPLQKLHFYELLAHNLTITVRSVWSNEEITDGEKLEQLKWINGISHRVTAKIWVLRLNTHEWTEKDMQEMIENYISAHPAIAMGVRSAIEHSYKTII